MIFVIVFYKLDLLKKFFINLPIYAKCCKNAPMVLGLIHNKYSVYAKLGIIGLKIYKV